MVNEKHLIDKGVPGGTAAHGMDPLPDNRQDSLDPSNNDSYSRERGLGGLTPAMSRTGSGRKILNKSNNGLSKGEKGYATGDDESSALGAFQERSLTWQQTAALLLTEYIVLAILAFASSYVALGMAGGIIATLIIGLSTLYTSHVLWRYCLRNPEVRDICDVAYLLCGRSRIAWAVCFVGLALNNLFIMGLHLNAGSTAINTLNHRGVCTVVWGVVLLAIMFIGSLVRNFRFATQAGIVSAGTMFACVMLVLIGHGVQGTPNGFVEGTSSTDWTTWAPEGTSFVSGMSALLNITYTFIGQALIPSFVGDMAHPEDFPKALYLTMAAELILFTLAGAIVYSYAGTALTTAPAYGSLIEKLAKPAAALVLPTIIIVGILYSLVTSRAVFFQIYKEDSIHRQKHTTKGWLVWISIVAVGWAIAFVIGESIPFFNDLLSLISSLFDSWFGYILWAFCWFEMNKHRQDKGLGYWAEYGLNILMLIVGFFFFGAGTYASVKSIINSYANGTIKTAFSCVNSGFTFTR